jgi:Fe-S-cluster containining protein
MPVEINFDDLLRLGFVSVDDQFISRRKLVKRLMSERKIASYRDHNELFTLASQPSGDCHLLNPKTRLCTVYEKRPHVCREFPSVGPRPGYCPANRSA